MITKKEAKQADEALARLFSKLSKHEQPKAENDRAFLSLFISAASTEAKTDA